MYDVGSSPITRRAGCTWTTGANGADAATGGAIDRTPDQVHALVKLGEETNPTTPGWSLRDLDLAMLRLGVPFAIRSGQGWAAVESALAAGLYVALQGDSDVFGGSTCSGTFDGDHCIGVRPILVDGDAWVDDPVCPGVRLESLATLRRYAEKLAGGILFGVFTDPVPGGSMDQAPITDEVPRTVTVAKGAKLYALDNRTQVGTAQAALGARPSPYAVGARRAIYATIGTRQVVLTAATIVPTPDPVQAEHDRVKAAAQDVIRRHHSDELDELAGL